ncbi:DoxX family membrane protein [Lapillicoccus sp.]|uniref:DoxX family membrane protein n=1 Tax=Lapillicoccus sp. TaxID=1909287 RepID=UPI0025CF5413|nr:DoxX family membrane protein [Lapillicoccus sp.]
MTIHQPIKPITPRQSTAPVSEAPMTSTAGKALAALRISTGFLFLWAFLDKTFGLNYATPSAKAWIHGGSPTNGFLKGVAVGPFESTAHAIAGTWWADWIFMLGLLGIGVALMAGIAMRIAAVSGVVMLAGMWLATYPLARFDSTGAATSSTDPFVDEHLTEALVLIVLAATCAGTTWGLGRMWARLPLVKAHRWAI